MITQQLDLFEETTTKVYAISCLGKYWCEVNQKFPLYFCDTKKVRTFDSIQQAKKYLQALKKRHPKSKINTVYGYQNAWKVAEVTELSESDLRLCEIVEG